MCTTLPLRPAIAYATHTPPSFTEAANKNGASANLDAHEDGEAHGQADAAGPVNTVLPVAGAAPPLEKAISGKRVVICDESWGYDEYAVFQGRAVCLQPTTPTAPAIPVDPRIIIDALGRRAFAFMPWAKPSLAVQPPNGQIMVTLPVFFHLEFITGGTAPGQVMTFPADQMAGFDVSLRPKVLAYRYIFGDGAASAATLSTGGTWPTGDITHAYAYGGTYQAYVEVTYTAEISVDGSPFQPFHQTATVTGPATPITALISHNILIK